MSRPGKSEGEKAICWVHFALGKSKLKVKYQNKRQLSMALSLRWELWWIETEWSWQANLTWRKDFSKAISTFRFEQLFAPFCPAANLSQFPRITLIDVVCEPRRPRKLLKLLRFPKFPLGFVSLSGSLFTARLEGTTPERYFGKSKAVAKGAAQETAWSGLRGKKFCNKVYRNVYSVSSHERRAHPTLPLCLVEAFSSLLAMNNINESNQT